VTVKADKDFAGAIGQKVGIAFEERAVHLFDTTSGERIS
jgi:multiple sugar transport system ATP-binding protein